MASQTQGIQQLLAAEKRAAEKVSEARKRKQRNYCRIDIYFLIKNILIFIINFLRQTKTFEAS